MWIKKSNRCNNMQIFIHCKTTLHVSGVTAPIIRSTKTVPAASGTGHTTCTATPLLRGMVWTSCTSRDLYRRLRVQFFILLMMGAVTPETCRVVLQRINICILLHLVGYLFTLNSKFMNTWQFLHTDLNCEDWPLSMYWLSRIRDDGSTEVHWHCRIYED